MNASSTWKRLFYQFAVIAKQISINNFFPGLLPMLMHDDNRSSVAVKLYSVYPISHSKLILLNNFSHYRFHSVANWIINFLLTRWVQKTKKNFLFCLRKRYTTLWKHNIIATNLLSNFILTIAFNSSILINSWWQIEPTDASTIATNRLKAKSFALFVEETCVIYCRLWKQIIISHKEMDDIHRLYDSNFCVWETFGWTKNKKIRFQFIFMQWNRGWVWQKTFLFIYESRWLEIRNVDLCTAAGRFIHL